MTKGWRSCVDGELTTAAGGGGGGVRDGPKISQWVRDDDRLEIPYG